VNTLWPYLLIDYVLVLAAILLTRRKLSLWHPFTCYLFFHIYTCTVRGTLLYFGARQVHEGLKNREVTSPDEIIRAIQYLDITLIAFLVGVLWAHRKFSVSSRTAVTSTVLSKSSFNWILYTCMPFGLLAFASQRLGLITEFQGHLAMVAFWPIACLCMGVFFFGFRLVLLLPIVAYLSIVALQGYHRFMTIFPLLFLYSIFLQRSNRKWPGLAGIAACIVGFLIFPELKYVGREFQRDGFYAAVERAAEGFKLKRDQERIEDLLDQLGGALTLIDKDKKIYFGETYLYIFAMPIPRVWWEEKPAINQHVANFSTPKRPYSQEGRVISLCGESYANFRIPGVVLVPMILGYALTIWCLHANFGPFRTLRRYCYLVIMVTFIQVYRDGLSSFAMFGLFQNVPMLVLVGFYLLSPTLTSTDYRPVSRPAIAPQPNPRLLTPPQKQ
jgi:hypothetical protein